MAIGTMESILIGIALFTGVAIFGRAGIKKFAQTVFGARRDIEEVKKEFETHSQN